VALSDFWQIKDNQQFDGKQILNVYQAKRILAGANATMVGQAFIDSIVTPMALPTQPIGLGRTTVEIENLGTPTDFTSIDSSAHVGGVAGQLLPGFVAATIQFNRTRSDMKNGMKRFCAGTESEMTNGIWVAGFLTLLDVIGTALVANWEEASAPGVAVCEFVILKRFCVDPVEDPCTVYRLPINSAEIDANHYVPVTFTTRDRVRSQVSRKVLA